ncbi:MAG: OmpA family protein [Pseudomonadota bacterium]
MMIPRLLHSTLAVVCMCTTDLALAVQPYWHDQDGRVVHDGSGGCVQTKDWTRELASADCGARPVARAATTPAARPAPAPAPVVAPPTPKAAPAPAAVPAEQPVTLRGDTSFAPGSDELRSAARAQLDQLAQRIRALESVDSIEVAGHTDNTGAAAFNQTLSERRAQSVKRYLVEQGVNGDRISTTGYGMNRPIADNTTAAGRATNRRVEITIHGAR